MSSLSLLFLLLLLSLLSLTTPAATINPYAVLSIPKTSSPQQVKRAYRKQSLLHHPDKVPPAKRSSSEKKFKQINEAYQILGDTARRKQYDDYGITDAKSIPTGYGQENPFKTSQGDPNAQGIDVEELLRAFSMRNGAKNGRRTQPGEAFGGSSFGGFGGASSFFDMFMGADEQAGRPERGGPTKPTKPVNIHIPLLKTLLMSPTTPLPYTVTKSSKKYNLKVLPTHQTGTLYKFKDATFSLVLTTPANIVTAGSDVTYTLRLTRVELKARLARRQQEQVRLEERQGGGGGWQGREVARARGGKSEAATRAMATPGNERSEQLLPNHLRVWRSLRSLIHPHVALTSLPNRLCVALTSLPNRLCVALTPLPYSPACGAHIAPYFRREHPPLTRPQPPDLNQSPAALVIDVRIVEEKSKFDMAVPVTLTTPESDAHSGARVVGREVVKEGGRHGKKGRGDFIVRVVVID